MRCPAAHSMDTTWFAVDADGCVAEFSTEEGGALPLSATATPEGGDFDRWPLLAVLVARGLADRTLPDFDTSPVPEYTEHAVLVLKPDAEAAGTTYRNAPGRSYAILDELRDDVVVVHEEPRIVATTRPLAPSRIAKLRDDPRVERVVWGDELWDWEEGAICRFSNDSPSEPGRYLRTRAPEHPLTVQALPGTLAQAMSRLQLPIRFVEAESLQLADFLRDEDCSYWSLDITLRGEPRELPAHKSAATRWILAAALIIALCLLLWLLW